MLLFFFHGIGYAKLIIKFCPAEKYRPKNLTKMWLTNRRFSNDLLFIIVSSVTFCTLCPSLLLNAAAITVQNSCRPFACLEERIHHPTGNTNPFAVDKGRRGQWQLRTLSDVATLCNGYHQVMDCWKITCPGVVTATSFSQTSLGTFGSTTNQFDKYIKVEALSSSPVGYGGGASGSHGSAYGSGGGSVVISNSLHNTAPYTLDPIDENTFAYIAQGFSLIESVCSSAFLSYSGELVRQWQQCDTTQFRLSGPDSFPFARNDDKVPATSITHSVNRQVFFNATNGFTTSALLNAGSAPVRSSLVTVDTSDGSGKSRSQDFEFVLQPSSPARTNFLPFARDAEPIAPPPLFNQTRGPNFEKQATSVQQRNKRAAGLPPADNCASFRNALSSEASRKCGLYGYDMLLNFVLFHAGCAQQQQPIQLRPITGGIDDNRFGSGASFVPGSGIQPVFRPVALPSQSSQQSASLMQLPPASLASTTPPSCSPLTMLNCAEDASLFDFLSSVDRMFRIRDVYCRDSPRILRQCSQQKCPDDLSLTSKLSPALSTVGNVCRDSNQFAALSGAIGRCPMFDNSRFAPTTNVENLCIDSALKRSRDDGTGTLVRTPADELCVRIDAAMYCRGVTLRCTDEDHILLRNYVKRFAACNTITLNGDSFGGTSSFTVQSENIVAAGPSQNAAASMLAQKYWSTIILSVAMFLFTSTYAEFNIK